MFCFFETRKSKRTRIHRRSARRGRRLRAFETLEDRRLLAVFVVDHMVDEADGDVSAGNFSLREAVAHANANGETDTIQLSAGVYSLSLPGAGDDSDATGDLDIFNDSGSHDVTIMGAGAGQTFIDATGLGDRVFHILNGASAAIEGVTISGGSVTGGGFDGLGGGIFVGIGSSLTVSDSEVLLNDSANGGGGIYNREGALTVLDSVITLNTSSGTGGGINNDRGTTVVERSTISVNTAANHGGGISSQVPVGFTGSLTVSDSTLVANTASGFGGGIAVVDGAAEVSSSTLSGNGANFGGGIHSDGTSTVTSSTLFENIAFTNGGGIYRDSGTANVGNTIVAGNFAGASNPDVQGIFVSDDFNLIGDGGSSNGFTGTADQVGTAASPINPLLGPLQDNGGPTATHAVLAGSPALNTGYDLVGAGLDQRGASRPVGPAAAVGGDGSDIGAFEHALVAPVANDDSEMTDEDHAVTIDVLDNDSGSGGALDPIAVIAVDTTGTVGSVSFTAGDVEYDPNGQFESLDSGDSTTDTFTYTMEDSGGGTAVATVVVTINGVNDAPVANVDAAGTTENAAVTVDVLANDTDVDGDDNPTNFSLDTIDSVVVSGLSIDPNLVSGSVSIVGNELHFDPDTDFDELAVGETATVTIGYTMSDDSSAVSSSTLTVTVTGQNDAPQILSLNSSNQDLMNKSDDGEVDIDGTFLDLDLSDVHVVTVDWGDDSGIETLLSVDQIGNTFDGSHSYTAGGIYTITVTLDDGNGVVDQQTTTAVVTGVGLVDGTLFIIGTNSRDVAAVMNVYGNPDLVRVNSKLGMPYWDFDFFDKNDVDRIEVHLCDGNDVAGVYWNIDIPATIYGDGGDDLLIGGLGDDILIGGSGQDYLQGRSGNDVLSGGEGNDWLFGSYGDDLLIGGEDHDKIFGGCGNDLLIGGSTANENDAAALQTALADWIADDLSAALADLGTITDDTDWDFLFGGPGDDEAIGGIGDWQIP